MSMTEHLNEFERLKSKIESYKMSLSSDVLAYRVLKSANLSEQHEQLARATISVLNYDNMKAQLRKIFVDSHKDDGFLSDLLSLKSEPQDSFFVQSSNRTKKFWKN